MWKTVGHGHMNVHGVEASWRDVHNFLVVARLKVGGEKYSSKLDCVRSMLKLGEPNKSKNKRI